MALVNPLTRAAGWAADRALRVPAAGVPYEVRHNMVVPMPDGVALLGDRYRPAGARGPMPVVLIRSPCGQFRPFLPERGDGVATVAWLRGQPWCDGEVAMTGGSYLGHTQWAVAPYVDPPLRSVSLNITAAAFSEAFYEHGAPSLLNTLNWTALERAARVLHLRSVRPDAVGGLPAAPAARQAGRQRRDRGQARRADLDQRAVPARPGPGRPGDRPDLRATRP